MTNENREDFIRVGDHDPEPRRDPPDGDSVAVMLSPGRYSLDHGRTWMDRETLERRIAFCFTEPKQGRVPRDIAERQLTLYQFALTGGPRIPDVAIQDEHIFYGADEELAAIDGAAFHPLGDAERDRQYAQIMTWPHTKADIDARLGLNQMTEAPVDSPVCKCHDRMGNDYYFLPHGFCLFDINECTDPQRRKTKT